MSLSGINSAKINLTVREKQGGRQEPVKEEKITNTKAPVDKEIVDKMNVQIKQALKESTIKDFTNAKKVAEITAGDVRKAESPELIHTVAGSTIELLLSVM